MFDENRHEPRLPVDLQIKLGDGAGGIARNVSCSGMYIQIRGHVPQDTTVTIEMQVPGEGMTFRGRGHIVRLDHQDGVTGIAVRLDAAQLEPT